jgi:hypothetical protein
MEMSDQLYASADDSPGNYKAVVLFAAALQLVAFMMAESRKFLCKYAS